MTDYLFFDTETHRFAPGRMAPPIVCFSFCLPNGAPTLVLADEGAAILGEALRKGFTVIAHFAAYDMACVLAGFPELAPLVWQAYFEGRVLCTKEREKLLDIADDCFGGSYNRKGQWVERGYSLDDCAQRYLNRKLDKDEGTWRLRFAELDGVPIEQWPERPRAYATEDAGAGMAVFLAQEVRAERLGYKMPTQALEARASFALQLARCWGMITDPVAVAELERKSIQKMGELAMSLKDAGLLRPKMKGRGKDKTIIGWSRYMKAIRERVADCWEVAQEGRPIPMTDGGKSGKKQICTDADTLEDCHDDTLDNLVEWARIQKTLGTFVDKYLKQRVPIHSRFEALGAATGRTSSSKPPLQQPPRLPGVRECFVPREGFDFLNCDYDTQELRTLGETMFNILGKSKLGSRLQADRHYDGHQEFANMVGAKRQDAKTVNFGVPGGMGVPGLIDFARGYGIRWSPKEAKWWLDKYNEMWPDMADYFQVIRSIVGQANYGTVVIPQTGFRRAGCAYTEAANCFFQSLAATISKDAFSRIARLCYDSTNKTALYGARPVNFLHDEVMLEVPSSQGDEAAKLVEKIMVETMEEWTPHIPAAATACLSTRWSKKAKPVFDEAGKLVPWSPEEK